EPIMAPLFYHYEAPALRTDAPAFLIGPDLLVLPVVEPGAETVEASLPDVPGGWHDLATGQRFAGGARTLDAPLSRLPILVRDGAILPLATDWPVGAPHDASAVALTLFAGETGRSAREVTFDDGLGWAYRDDDLSRLACAAEWDRSIVRLTVEETATGRGRPALTLACATLGDRSLETRGPG
ncbi:MAG: hypothetical protein AAF321_01800, partial [Pseudomonadota bacterium]